MSKGVGRVNSSLQGDSRYLGECGRKCGGSMEEEQLTLGRVKLRMASGRRWGLSTVCRKMSEGGCETGSIPGRDVGRKALAVCKDRGQETAGLFRNQNIHLAETLPANTYRGCESAPRTLIPLNLVPVS